MFAATSLRYRKSDEPTQCAEIARHDPVTRYGHVTTIGRDDWGFAVSVRIAARPANTGRCEICGLAPDVLEEYGTGPKFWALGDEVAYGTDPVGARWSHLDRF